MATTHNKTRSTRNNIEAVQYKRPLGLSPWAKAQEGKNGSVWISMKPKKILDQYTKGAGTYATEDIPVEFLFLAPLALSENIVHRWESYESVSSRLAQKARSIAKLANEGRALWNAGKRLFNQDAATAASKLSENGLSVEDWVRDAYNNVPGSQIPKVKIDTPLYYANSERRQIIFEFQLFNESIQGYDPDQILLKPIQEMMKYSSPDLIKEGGIDIEFPYMWEVKSLPQQFILYKTCVLTAVQPTWNSPYVNGYPISCNLQLTFQDLSPLYAGTIEYGSIINVKSDSVENALARDRNATNNNQQVKPAIKRLSARQKVTGV